MKNTDDRKINNNNCERKLPPDFKKIHGCLKTELTILCLVSFVHRQMTTPLIGYYNWTPDVSVAEHTFK